MAHIRDRFVESHIRESLGFSPLVGVLGMRQVGKTTLAERILGDSYRTFDDDDQLSAASIAPSEYLSQFSVPTVLDECQKVPGIFPALKLRVQRSKRPGQFLLTGSVRFTSRKAIRESLTGRIHNVEVLPLSIAEMNRLVLNQPSLWRRQSLAGLQRHMNTRLKSFSIDRIPAFLSHGGLPGICFLRKESHRKAAFKSLLETILERDLRMVVETTVPYTRLLELLRYLARRQGTPFNERDACRSVGLSGPTVGKLVSAFEALFLVRRFSGSGDRRGDVFYFEDQGLASYLAADFTVTPELRFAFSQLFASMHYGHMNQMTMTYFETKGGALVPLVFEVDGQHIGFILNPSESVTASAVKTTKAFQERFSGATVYLLSRSTQVAQVFERVWRVPLAGIV